MKWLELLKTFGPLVLSQIPGVPPVVIPAIIHGIAVAESMKGATGAEKKAAALDLVATGMTTANAFAGKVILDPVALSGVVGQSIDAVVDTVNIVHGVNNNDLPALVEPIK
jgi:hypothetical protein